jgi:hypothetical protein
MTSNTHNALKKVIVREIIFSIIILCYMIDINDINLLML